MRFSTPLARYARGTVFPVIFLFAILAAPAQAQVTASISGTVTDPSGRAVARAVVVAREQETGFVRSTVTDTRGRYYLLVLPVGQYKMTVWKKGFKTAARAGITLTAAEQAVLNFALQLGKVKQERKSAS